MSKIHFQSFQEGLNPSETLMVDGYSEGYRTISHWPGHSTPAQLRHDLTTGSALKFAALSPEEKRDLVGEFSIVTNNHIDADGVLSAFCVLNPDLALKHRDLILRTAATGDLAKWTGPDALALELTLMSEAERFEPFYGEPMTDRHWANMADAYQHCFWLLEETLLDDPFAIQNGWADRHRQVVADIEGIDAGEGVRITRYPEEDLAVIEVNREITLMGLRHAAGDLYRILLAYSDNEGTRYRFCYRAESWFDVVSITPQPRKPLDGLAARLNELEQNKQYRWWSTPTDWVVPELGFGEATIDELQASSSDPDLRRDPPSSLSIEVVMDELLKALSSKSGRL
ncbi:hypothetical protein QMT40_001290 [Parvibaculaceae bacterium PLY_AMNH_Bact1]|nr:hypothetical protein QMT40_001290 [Parvibaculaceae bacterium PLY_AMNH_Bact1]